MRLTKIYNVHHCVNYLKVNKKWLFWKLFLFLILSAQNARQTYFLDLVSSIEIGLLVQSEISKGKREGQIRIRWVHFHSFAKMGYTFEKLEKNKEIKLCQIVYENGEFVAQVSHYREKPLDYLWSVQKYLLCYEQANCKRLYVVWLQ